MRNRGQPNRLALEYSAERRDYAGLVERVRQGSPRAIAELYTLFRENAISQVRASLGAQADHFDMEDRLHDSFLAAFEVIEAGLIREPAKLTAFLNTLVRYQISAAIRDASRDRKRRFELHEQGELAHDAPGPETAHLEFEHRKLLCSLLQKLVVRDREILGRFYLEEQSPVQICQEMNLTNTQFRLYKSRAKARLRAVAETALGSEPRKQSAVIELPIRRH